MVSPTYSVIIQNRPTMELFSHFHPLFSDAINSNRINVCKWNESGTTLDTAVPELADMINDKDEWRAVIIRYIDEQQMSQFEASEKNPYDFVVNQNPDEDTIKESEVPLIRLTQMLGGVPAPEKKFVCEMLQEEGRVPRIVYRSVDTPERDAAYERLCEKYAYDGKMPKNIVLINVRQNYKDKAADYEAWKPHRESDSSQFWKRNSYPSICRFTTFDFSKKGPIEHQADDFRFWLSVRMLVTNEIDPNILQAYRLYRLNAVFDRKRMKQTFDGQIALLAGTRQRLINESNVEFVKQVSIKPILPEYKVEIPVEVDVPLKDEITMPTGVFKTYGQGANKDLREWNTRTEKIEEEFRESVRLAERTLDQAADRVRVWVKHTEDDTIKLDKYQTEDLTREAEELFEDIIRLQGELPNRNISIKENSTEEQTVRDLLFEQFTNSYTAKSLAVASILVLLCNIPVFYYLLQDDKNTLLYALLLILLEVVIIVLGGLIPFLQQRFALKNGIEAYNTLVEQSFSRFTGNATVYSEYLSTIASHKRAKYYLDHSERMKYNKNTKYYQRQKHISAISAYINCIREWANAYHISLEDDIPELESMEHMDVMVPPTQNTLYYFGGGETFAVEVNKTGSFVDSPVNFIGRFEIVREELYDNE